jgi:putative intracellular protease/amidase
MKILMVLTSHDQLGDTGKKTGFWLEEFAAPYYALKDAGAEITLASPKGGQPPLDPKSDDADAQTDDTRRFKADAEAQKALASTEVLASVDAAAFDAVFYPGGHGPLWDLAEDANSISLIEAFAKADKPVGAVCHAPGVFKKVKAADGSKSDRRSLDERQGNQLAQSHRSSHSQKTPRQKTPRQKKKVSLMDTAETVYLTLTPRSKAAAAKPDADAG